MNPYVFRNRPITKRAKPAEVVELGLSESDLESHRDLFSGHEDPWASSKVDWLLDCAVMDACKQLGIHARRA